MTDERSPAKGQARTVADLERERDLKRAMAGGAPAREVQYGAQATLAQLWNTGLRVLTNKTRQPGEPATAGINLFYVDLEWTPFAGPGEPAGSILKEDDQRPNTNTFDAGGIILPWCSNSWEVRNKAIVVHELSNDLHTIGVPLLYLFQYYWDNAGYYSPASFAIFNQKASLGEGPSSNLNVDLLYTEVTSAC